MQLYVVAFKDAIHWHASLDVKIINIIAELNCVAVINTSINQTDILEQILGRVALVYHRYQSLLGSQSV